MSKYERLLKNLPAPGIGAGYHTGIFGVACAGRDAGLPPAQIESDIRANTKAGSRIVGEREIEDAVKAAFSRKAAESKPYTGPRVRPDFLAECLRKGKGATMDDISARSPVKLDWTDEEGWRALPYLYDRDNLLFIGDDRTPGILGKSIRSCSDWHEEFEYEGVQHPKVISNPLTGDSAPTKSGGGFTLRGDGCIAQHRFAIAESDSLSLEDQCAFWMGCPTLPVAALIFSGSKSIHAWIRVDCADATEWETKIAGELFPGFLVPLGMDASCKNPARLSRMPGFYRIDKDAVQKLIYLAPEGKAVAA